MIPYNSLVEGKTYTVRVPESGLYLMRRDRSKDAITIGDSAGGFEGFQYVVFLTESPPGEAPSAALLRHFGKHAAGDGWSVVATREGSVKGSAGQVDLHTPRGRGFVSVAECFRDESRLWVVARMEPLFGRESSDVADRLKSARSSLDRFAKSFQRKSGT